MSADRERASKQAVSSSNICGRSNTRNVGSPDDVSAIVVTVRRSSCIMSLLLSDFRNLDLVGKLS